MYKSLNGKKTNDNNLCFDAYWKTYVMGELVLSKRERFDRANTYIENRLLIELSINRFRKRYGSIEFSDSHFYCKII